jgi:phenylacetate-CoA ligase
VAVHHAHLEGLAPAQLRKLQWKRFTKLLQRVAQSNDFYRERFADAGVDARQIERFEDLPLLPLTRKEDVLADIAAAPPYGRRLEVPRDRIDKVIESSGSTGLGREVQALTARDTRAFHELSSFGLDWARVGRGTVVMTTVPMTTTGAGQTYHGGLRDLGANVFHIGMYDAARKVDCMRRFEPEVLIATPSYLRRLEHVAEEEGVEPRALGVKTLVVAGEPFSIDFGLAREEAWGATLFEQYGSTQRAAAWTCERGALPGGERGMLHNLSHLTLCEVVDPQTGRHVNDGERGELVVTPLHTEATPLIRYATGDSVRFLESGSCPCGRPFEGFESGTVQRIDQMLKVRGVNVWPETVDGIVLAHEAIRDYRGEVSLGPAGEERLRLSVEIADPAQPVSAEAIASSLRRAVGLDFDIQLCEPGTLPESDDSFAKSRRWIDTRRSVHAG